jgi:hypothetical protein
MRALAAVNVDVDSLYLYYGLHGLDASRDANQAWERGVTRFLELFDEVGIKATFFVVAADLGRWPKAREIAAEIARQGHEIGNHTYSHPYDLIRRDPDVIADEIDRADEVLSLVAGKPVRGFRAPGYHISAPVFAHLGRRGYAYSSSVFPSVPYHLAKWAVMAGMRLRGRPTQAIAGSPRMLWAPRLPHAREGVLEIPVTVLPWTRFPVIGTSLAALGESGYRVLQPMLDRLPFTNLELHAVDLCDLEGDGIEPALARQPDLRIPVAKKRALFRRVLQDLRDRAEVARLDELAPRLRSAYAPELQAAP